jgi:hypothetical protein
LKTRLTIDEFLVMICYSFNAYEDMVRRLSSPPK